ncbi:MAG: twin-arginine translocase TatA/TatE family subunit [Actinomycetota bacterium]
MGNIGPFELIMILVVALLVFGPRRLPEIGRSVGRGLKEFRRASNDLRSQLELDVDDEPPAAPVVSTPVPPTPAPRVAPRKAAARKAAARKAAPRKAAPRKAAPRKAPAAKATARPTRSRASGA